MATLRIQDQLKDRILISRDSARQLVEPLADLLRSDVDHPAAPAESPLIVDFAGIAGIAPSFVDELIRVFESVLESGQHRCNRQLIVANPPTRLSLKFEAIARGHGMSVRALPDGSWLLAFKIEAQS